MRPCRPMSWVRGPARARTAASLPAAALRPAGGAVGAYRLTCAPYAGWDWPAGRAGAARFEAPIAAFRPAYLEEIRGIAEGAGLDPVDVLAINVRTEVMFAARARQARESQRWPAECSSFAVIPPPGGTGPVLAGQNWDWVPAAAANVVVLEAQQDDGPDYVTVV